MHRYLQFQMFVPIYFYRGLAQRISGRAQENLAQHLQADRGFEN